MSDSERAGLHSNETSFFADYYKLERYNPLGWRLRLERERNSLLRVLAGRRPARMLSLGCGDGQFEILMAPHVDQILALDLSNEAIQQAIRNRDQAGIRNIEFQCRPVESLELGQNFDVVVCLAFLHHLREVDVLPFLKSCVVQMVAGGVFYSQDPNRGGILRKVGRIVMGQAYHRYHSPDERELDPRETAELLRRAGLRDVQIGHIDLTLIPALFLLAGRPGGILYLCRWLDWLWCRSPLAPWSSGFTLSGRK